MFIPAHKTAKYSQVLRTERQNGGWTQSSLFHPMSSQVSLPFSRPLWSMSLQIKVSLSVKLSVHEVTHISVQIFVGIPGDYSVSIIFISETERKKLTGR
jgi:hypothetical protein